MKGDQVARTAQQSSSCYLCFAVAQSNQYKTMGRTRRPAVLTGKLCGCGQSYVGVLGVQQLRRKLYWRFVSSFSFLRWIAGRCRAAEQPKRFYTTSEEVVPRSWLAASSHQAARCWGVRCTSLSSVRLSWPSLRAWGINTSTSACWMPWPGPKASR